MTAPTLGAPAWGLQRNAFGKLVFTPEQGAPVEGVQPVRAFPIQAPEDGISLLHPDGQELVWIERLSALPEALRTLVTQELQGREMMPVIGRIASVSSYATPSTWQVETDRGTTHFVLRGDEDIRRVGTEGMLLIADSHGIQYLVRDQYALDAHSKKILDRFL